MSMNLVANLRGLKGDTGAPGVTAAEMTAMLKSKADRLPTAGGMPEISTAAQAHAHIMVYPGSAGQIESTDLDELTIPVVYILMAGLSLANRPPGEGNEIAKITHYASPFSSSAGRAVQVYTNLSTNFKSWGRYKASDSAGWGPWTEMSG